MTPAVQEAEELLSLLPRTNFPGLYYTVTHHGQQVRIARIYGKGRIAMSVYLHLWRDDIHYKIQLDNPTATWKMVKG